MITATLAALVLRERPSSRRVVGIALSLIGVFAVVLVASPNERARNPLLGGAIMLGAVGMWAIYTCEPLIGWQLAGAAVTLLGLWLAT